MITTSGTIAELAKALALAQQGYQPIEKDQTAKAGQYSYDYADMATCLDATLPALNKNGLSYIQGADADGNVVSVTTRLIHISGEWIESVLHTVAESAAPQKVGSAISYARRYSYLALVGAMPRKEDDDGAAAGTGQPVARRFPQPPPDKPRPAPPMDEPPPEEEKEVFPGGSAKSAGDAMAAALGKIPKPQGTITGKGPAPARKEAVLSYLLGHFGNDMLMRVGLSKILGRTFPLGEEIRMNLTELAKLEAFAIAEEAASTERDRT